MEKIRVDFLLLLSFYLWTFSFILPILCKEAMWRHLHTVLFFAWKSPFWRPIGKYYIISKKQKLCNTITYYHFLNVVLFLYFYKCTQLEYIIMEEIWKTDNSYSQKVKQKGKKGTIVRGMNINVINCFFDLLPFAPQHWIMLNNDPSKLESFLYFKKTIRYKIL